MSFIAPRFVVVDDDERHLSALINVFQALGSPCLGIRYRPETGVDAHHFRGVRVLFLDLHLLPGALGTDDTRHFAEIARILEDSISPTGGPFILIIWTQNAQLVPSLIAYLDANLDPQKPHAHPLALLTLAKEKYIQIDSGDLHEPEYLRNDVEAAIKQNPQIAALLAWERDVLAASGATLSTVVELVPDDRRLTASYSSGLDDVLSRLAVAAVGKPNVAADKRAALNTALGPILADRVQNQAISPDEQNLWSTAITKDAGPNLADLDPTSAGRFNRMLHIAVPGSEAIRGVDWGAVIEMLPSWCTDDEMTARFGATLNTILGGDFKVDRRFRDQCRMRLIRIGAACDHAQGRSGPLPFVLAVEIPIGIERPKTQAAEWATPVLVLPNGEPFRLVAHCRYIFSAPAEAAARWTALYRLRSEILMNLIAHAGQYVSRPGIVCL